MPEHSGLQIESAKLYIYINLITAREEQTMQFGGLITTKVNNPT